MEMSAQGLMFNRIQHWPKQFDLNLWSLISKWRRKVGVCRNSSNSTG